MSARSNKLNVDTYVFFSQEGVNNQNGLAGIARMSLCDTRKWERFAIVEYTGKATKAAKDKNWAKGKLEMAMVNI